MCAILSPEKCAAQQYGPRIVVILRQRFNIRYTVGNNTCASTIQMGNIVAFLWQQWASERAITHTAYLTGITFPSYANHKSIPLMGFPVSLVLRLIEITHFSCVLPSFLPAATAQSAFILLLLLTFRRLMSTIVDVPHR